MTIISTRRQSAVINQYVADSAFKNMTDQHNQVTVGWRVQFNLLITLTGMADTDDSLPQVAEEAGTAANEAETPSDVGGQPDAVSDTPGDGKTPGRIISYDLNSQVCHGNHCDAVNLLNFAL